MLSVCLDTNCLYDLEEATPNAGPIKGFMAACERGEIERTFAQFQGRLATWSHIHHGGQVLVTRDGDFLKRGEKLAELGAGSVVSPAQGLEVLGSVIR